MSYNIKPLNSRRLAEVLGYLARVEKSYSTKIAEDLEMNRTQVTKILSQLEELSVIKKAERKKAQYYEINTEGLTNYYFDSLSNKIDQKKLQEFRSDKVLRTFVGVQLVSLLESTTNSTLYDLFYRQFPSNLNLYIENERPKWSEYWDKEEFSSIPKFSELLTNELLDEVSSSFYRPMENTIATIMGDYDADITIERGSLWLSCQRCGEPLYLKKDVFKCDCREIKKDEIPLDQDLVASELIIN